MSKKGSLGLLLLVVVGGICWAYAIRAGKNKNSPDSAGPGNSQNSMPSQAPASSFKPSASQLSPADLASLERIQTKAFGKADRQLLKSYTQAVTVNVGTGADAPPPPGKPAPPQPQKRSFEMSVAYAYPAKSVVWIYDANQSVFSIVVGDKGWSVTKNSRLPKPLVADVNPIVGRAQIENHINSIQGLLYWLTTEPSANQNLAVKQESGYVIISTARDEIPCDYYFSIRTWLCEKLVKRNPKAELTVLYSDYKAEQGILLPHKLEMKLADGRDFGTHIVAKWALGASLPDSFFTAEGVSDF